MKTFASILSGFIVLGFAIAGESTLTTTYQPLAGLEQVTIVPVTCHHWHATSAGSAVDLIHVKNVPPKSMKVDDNGNVIPSSMKDDVTGEPLTQRRDDNKDALKTRLQAYHSQTKPIVSRYRPFGIVSVVDCNRAIDAIWNDIREGLKVKT